MGIILKGDKKMKKLTITKKEIFDFHNNLMTISEEEYLDCEKCTERELKYIENWLKSKGIKIVEK